ncbi:MAG TPA: hypothetical protein VHM31_03045 [Polyangia bacterium]|nr:hypothetical protein [Polyangia bacterium]
MDEPHRVSDLVRHDHGQRGPGEVVVQEDLRGLGVVKTVVGRGRALKMKRHGRNAGRGGRGGQLCRGRFVPELDRATQSLLLRRGCGGVQGQRQRRARIEGDGVAAGGGRVGAPEAADGRRRKREHDEAGPTGLQSPTS